MSIAVLVATKNRPEKLSKLLESLTLSANFISQVVIVSSGQNISQVIANFSDSLNLKHLHSEASGQITQKMQGIKQIDRSIKWVLFLDDDVTISEQAFETLINRYLKNPKFAEVYGFGLKIDNLEFRRYTRTTQYFLRIFGLYSNKSGSVLKSGHAQTYQDSLSDIETQWLNGISIWRVESLKSYSSRFQAIDYAAYEDVIFSYRVSRKNRLIFASVVPVVSQDTQKYAPLTFTQHKAGSYMRYLFVTENRNLSRSIFLISQLFRIIDFTINGDHNMPIFKRFLKSFFIWCDLFLAVIIKTDPKNLLDKRYLKSQ
jgi:glycosyltransferase involved in cell wall biosynthesis